MIQTDEDLGYNNDMPDDIEYRRKILAVKNITWTMEFDFKISQIKAIINAVENPNEILQGD